MYTVISRFQNQNGYAIHPRGGYALLLMLRVQLIGRRGDCNSKLVGQLTPAFCIEHSSSVYTTFEKVHIVHIFNPPFSQTLTSKWQNSEHTYIYM